MRLRAVGAAVALLALALVATLWILEPGHSRGPAVVPDRDDLAALKPGRGGPEPAVHNDATAATPEGSAPVALAAPQEPQRPEIIRPDAPGANGNRGPADTSGTRPQSQDSTPDPDAPGRKPAGTTTQPGAQEQAPATPTLPTPARVPTPRERAERARYAGGANLPKAESIPKTSSQDEIEPPPLDMTRLAEPEVWAEYWAREDYAAPAMIKTPVRGKLMARLAQTGIAGATVRLFTFFPATSQLGGPVLPVVMEAISDAQGFFNSNLPVPAKWPTAYAKLALSVEAEQLRLVDALIVPELRPGEHNEIGVFWAPEEPYEIEVKVTAARTGLTAAATGRVDPRRWEAWRAAKTFAYFNRVPVGAGGAKLQGTWDILAEPPFVTLLESGAAVMTKQAERILEPPPLESNDSETSFPELGRPFLPLTFENDGYITLRGSVSHPYALGASLPVAGATVTLIGDGTPFVAFTDESGQFAFHWLRTGMVKLRAEHSDFMPVESEPVQISGEHVRLRFEYYRPRVNLTVTRSDNGQVVPAVWFRVLEPDPAIVWLRAASPTGVYAFEWEKAVSKLVVCAPGLEPQQVGFGELDQTISLEPGRPLSRRPRDFDAASWPEGWQTEGETPCLWSLDDDHWVEYKFNFGDTEADFALELGVKNHSYGTLPLDNEFLFEVEVYVDGAKKATLSIPSDAQVARYVLLPLGKLSGEHSIRLKWINDRYIPGQLDANISYESIELFQTAP